MELAERAELSLESTKRVKSGKRTMSLENFLRIADALHTSLPYLLYKSKEDIPEVEQLNNILQRGNGEQRKYLLHMLCEMEKGMDELM